ncbi:MAG: competence/damage-inducible protein A [Lachnospiraceae bacterium]|nr:competence/damage-inducible protein A [Candidatus Colinaster scatohippi]
MIAEIISVGTELLLGNIINTNAAYLAEQCAVLGLSCYYQDVVGDNEERLAATIKMALDRSDIVFIGGGLGPTPDDLSKEVAAKVAGVPLIMDEESRTAIAEYFKRIGKEPTDNNWKQAMMPEGCAIFPNNNGTAPGCAIKTGEKHIILLPGPPEELKLMFEESVVPYIKGLMSGIIYSKTVKICGIGESRAASMISDLIEEQSNPTIATYAKTGEVHIRVSAKADSESDAKKLAKPVVKGLKERFGSYIYTTEVDVTLEKAVVDLIIANGLTVGTVESCTGGMVAARLINVPGVSDAFKSGIVTYSNKAKRRFVGVKKATLDKYGAVSKQTATEMAKGLSALNKADVVISTTGIAGPDGGTEDKPVGLVYIGCYVCGKTSVKECHFTGNRQKIRENTVVAALNFTRECILEYYSEKTFGKKN